MNFTIKKLSAQEFLLAQELFTLFQIDDGVENPTVASEEYLKDLLSRDDFHAVVVMENEIVIGGLAAYELAHYKEKSREMFIYEIAVEASHRRKGVAKALIETLKKICTEKGIKEMFVGASASNTPALKLYESTGGMGEKVIEFDYELD